MDMGIATFGSTHGGWIQSHDSTNAATHFDLLLNPNGGNVGIGATSPGEKLHIDGKLRFEDINTSGPYWDIYCANNSHFYFTKQSSDVTPGYLNGTNGAWVDNISFTGQHRCLMNDNKVNTYIGLIVSTTNNFINLDNSITSTINESLPYCVITNTDNDKKVFGVISDKEDTETVRSFASGNFVSNIIKQNPNEQRIYINSLGEGAIWVCNKNGTLESGDYISSTTVIGYGGKQILEPGTLKNYTVAKITCDGDFSLTKIVKQKLKVNTITETKTRYVYEDVDKTETKTEIVYDNTLQKYVQKTTTETKTTKEQMFDTVDLYNESGVVIGTHQAPRTESYTQTYTDIDHDANGDVQYEDELDTSGNPQMIYPLETKFLQSDGTQLTDETDYTTRLAAGESVYIACFVGCTYHCG
jgi:hypothetical protein